MVSGYYVAEPNSYLVITGAGIEGIRIRKKAFLWPLQRLTKISITPFDFSMHLQAMTIEKLKFSLPAVFTIGPLDTVEAMTKYAVLLTGQSDGTPIPRKDTVATGRSHVQEIVKGIIEGETRSIVSTMTMEELFKERQIFKKKVIDSVQSELDQFGLCIYNANVKELQDTPGSEYFAFLSRKAHEGALNQAKVDVAEARARGEVGEAEKQGRAKQEVAKIHAATAVLETERKGEKATADAKLTNKEIQIEKELNLERISAKRAAESRDAQLQKEVEMKRAEMELERLRATTVTQSKISRESAEQKAMADLYTSTKKADAIKYQQQADAEAEYYRQIKEADAALETRTKAAQALFAERKAEADGLAQLAHVYGQMANVLGGPQGLMQWMMLRDNVYEKLALANAKAVNGLQPKINVWTTGQGDGADAGAPIRNIMQSLPPLLSTIQEQTGIVPPTWLAQMPSIAQSPTLATKKVQVNGVH